jgi:bifunctional ADP-heptose synthase (sugar kinase/adenylyltransferase)
LIESANHHGVPVIIDPRLGDDLSIYRGATALTPNRYETERATVENVCRVVKPNVLLEREVRGSGLSDLRKDVIRSWPESPERQARQG